LVRSHCCITTCKARPANSRGGPAKETVTSEHAHTSGRTGENEAPPSAGAPTGGDRSLRRLTWVLPALAFLVGVVLGAAVVGAIASGGAGTAADGSADEQRGATRGTTAVPSPGQPRDTTATVTVPSECAALADDAQDAASLLEQAATAARDLDAKTLADVARRMRDARDHLTAQADACRGAAPSVSLSSG